MCKLSIEFPLELIRRLVKPMKTFESVGETDIGLSLKSAPY